MEHFSEEPTSRPEHVSLPMSQGGSKHRSERLTELPLSTEENKSQYNEHLKVAQEELFNDKTRSLFLRSVQKIEQRGGRLVEAAALQNKIIKYCLPLNTTDTQALVRNLNRHIRDWGRSIRPEDRNSMNSILQGTYDIHINGILSVIEYIKTRQALFAGEKDLSLQVFFNDELDAGFGIDLFEIESENDASLGESHIRAVNLVQIKSREPSEKEVETIIDLHTRWLRDTWLDLDSFGAIHDIEGDPQAVLDFEKHHDSIVETLLEFLTAPEQDIEEMLRRIVDELTLSNLSDRQRAWLLFRYSDEMQKQVGDMVAELYGSKEGDEAVKLQHEIKGRLNDLTEKLVRKAKLPRQYELAPQVHTVLAVGKRIVQTYPHQLSGPKIIAKD